MFSNFTTKKIGAHHTNFEVYDSKTGELLGAVLRDFLSPEEKDRVKKPIPYEVYYKGTFVGEATALPLAFKLIDDHYKSDNTNSNIS